MFSLRKRCISVILAVSMIGSLYSISISAEGFYGAPDEWSDINYDSITSTGDLIHLKALQKGTKLYLNVKGTNLDAESTFFIDSDNDVNVGYSSLSWTNSTGIDYKIENEMLYKYETDQWVDTGETVSIMKNTAAIEVAVDLSDIGLMSSQDLRVSYFKPGNNFLPKPSHAMLDVPASQQAYEDDVSIVVDGLTADWAGVVSYSTSTDQLTTVTTSVNNNQLNVMLEGFIGSDSVMDNIWEHFYLDTDKDASTGSAFGVYGADYLVQRGHLYKWEGGVWAEQNDVFDYVRIDNNGLNGRVIEFSIPFSSLELDYPQGINLAFTTGTVNAPDPWGATKLTTSSLPNVDVDGDPSEWGGLGSLAISSNDIVQNFSGFVKTDDSLNFLIQSSQPIANYLLSINTDNDTATGYQNWGQYGTSAGADYMVNGGSLLKRNAGQNNNEWAWTWIAPAQSVTSSVYTSDTSEILEISIPLSSIENYANTISAQIEINNSVANTDYAPPIWATGGSYAQLLTSSGREIVIDGDDAEWIEIDNMAIADTTPITLSVIQDNKKLYSLIEGVDLNTQNVFYMDSDNDSSTGYHSPSWADSGIDYKVEHNHLQRYVAESSWEDVGPVYVNVTPTTVEMVLYLDMIDRVAPGLMKVSYASKYALTLPESGNEMLTVTEIMSNPEQPHTFYPRESFATLNNPYMGWIPWALDGNKALNEPYPQPHSTVYTGVSWKELEPVKGQFAWDALEDKYQFDYWTSLGKKINLRFVMDTPSSDPLHKDIPEWLYNELVAAEGEAGAGKWYVTDSIGSGFAPNYSSSLLITEHERMIEAVADRYNNDPRIAFVQIGSLGHWGEFHNWPEEVSGIFPKVTISDQYVQHYLDNFNNKLSGMRKPFPIAAQNSLGLFNDVFGDKGPTDQFLGWVQQGWNDIALYNDTELSNADLQAASAMPDFWKHSFSGGEFSNGNSALWLHDGTIMESLRQARVSHTSWLGPSSPADYELGDMKGSVEVTENVLSNMDTLLRTMGYRYVLESISHPSEVTAGTTISLETNWNNKGVAPFYFDWPLQISLANSSGTVVASTNASDVDIRSWLPGRSSESVALDIPAKLKKGEYTILVSIIDPETGNPGIDLAIESERSDGRYALGTVTVIKGKKHWWK